MRIVYFSNYSGNTKRFIERLGVEDAIRIPIKWEEESPVIVDDTYVLCVPTYGGGSESPAVPKQVKKFLNIEVNRKNLVGIIGLGDTNFGQHFCKAADIISAKTGVPVIYKLEVFGTPDDIINVRDRLEKING
jgi:protein involved in ribonucleotide reduction